VKSIIDNYNKYLSKITDNDLLVLRLFQEQDEQATIIKDTAIVDYLSEEFLKDVYPSLNIYGNSKSDKEFGKIAISNYDIERNINDGDMFVEIDFDKKLIETDNIYDIYDIDEYCEQFLISKDELELEMCPDEINLLLTEFNEIEDVINFIKRNSLGWYDIGLTDTIFVPFD
jgi:hypothetical protein